MVTIQEYIKTNTKGLDKNSSKVLDRNSSFELFYFKVNGL